MSGTRVLMRMRIRENLIAVPTRRLSIFVYTPGAAAAPPGCGISLRVIRLVYWPCLAAVGIPIARKPRNLISAIPSAHVTRLDPGTCLSRFDGLQCS